MNYLLVRTAAYILLFSFLAACTSELRKTPQVPGAKNIILFIGDGMGSEHRKAAQWISVGETGMLQMDDMPANGWLKTHSADNPVADSAAAATAMASGVKTKNGVVGLDANLASVETILELAQSRGKSAGLVTTTQITHATPAAFASHVADRNSMTEIAEHLLTKGVDVLLGGGENEFLPATDTGCFPMPGNRIDHRNLIHEAIAAGYVYVCDLVSFGLVDYSSTFKLIGLFADEGMIRPFSPSLSDMTQKAIDLLSRNPRGFFLMVEAGQIDWASHSNDAANAISDTLGLEEAVKTAKKFALLEGDTLIIVTADHETGGMLISAPKSGAAGEAGPFFMPDNKQFYVNWLSTVHEATDVPVTAQGPLSGLLTGINDNTFVYKVMLEAFDLHHKFSE